jgi:hypothetical protein
VAQEQAGAMGDPGHKSSQHLIESEAYRRILTGELPERLDQFAQQLLCWFRKAHPDATRTTLSTVEDQIRETWERRHEIIRGG